MVGQASLYDPTRFPPARASGCSIANFICNHDPKATDSQFLEKISKNIFVVAGTQVAIQTFIEQASILGFRAKPIRGAGGAFHTQAMARAQAGLRKAVGNAALTIPKDCLIYSNVTGEPYSSLSELRSLLVRQIVCPVMWHETITNMRCDVNDLYFIACGPGEQLRSMLSAIDSDLGSATILSEQMI